MTHLICRFIGHVEYDQEVFESSHWDLADFQQFSKFDYREPNCLRCGEPLHSKAA